MAKEAIIFTNEETAKGFEALVDTDQTIHIAGQYSGKLSAVPAAVAEKMVKRKTNLLKAKEAPEVKDQKAVQTTTGNKPPEK